MARLFKFEDDTNPAGFGVEYPGGVEQPGAITLALPKGKLGEEAVALAAAAGLPTQGVATEERQLLFEFPSAGVRYIICRPTDVPVYVEFGAADLGIAGKDTIVEAGSDVFELVDLKFGYCRFVVAVPERIVSGLTAGEKTVAGLASGRRLKVATKFPRVARNFFNSRGLAAEVIKLHGNIELAARVGLADAIVDIVSTGRTLRENGLVEVEEVFSATARLIANRVSFRLKYGRLKPLVDAFRRQGEKDGDCDA